MVKGALKYSKACKAVKIIAKITVTIKLRMAGFLQPAIMALCDQVTVAPESNNIKVFTKGISHGDNTSIPFGG